MHIKWYQNAYAITITLTLVCTNKTYLKIHYFDDERNGNKNLYDQYKYMQKRSTV